MGFIYHWRLTGYSFLQVNLESLEGILLPNNRAAIAVHTAIVSPLFTASLTQNLASDQ
ncbi:MAG: hypothetical protein HC780_01090 [Leptolyngbyaceae cyanobacterium CSU_1_3]|nr:hypothetical protein [Leptolyngbyaceae cyanobacterium CSU_1_3]